MTYKNLYSEDGREALLRALETPSVARVARGKISIDDAMGMAEQEALAAFQLIRFSDTNGIPKCRRCGSTDSYTLTAREDRVLRWKCKHCEFHFTVTNGTMLHGRKMGLAKYLAILSVILDKNQVRSLLQFSKDTGISYKTVWAQTNHFRACINGIGCTVPFSLISREDFRVRFAQVRTDLQRFIVQPKDQYYPYFSGAKAQADGADLVAFVNKAVPKWMPDYMRADICQDMIVAILSGAVTREQITADGRAFVTKVFQQYPWKYKWISFDAPLAISDDGGINLHDVISDERAKDLFDRYRG